MDIQALIRQRAIAAGVDPTAALAIAKIESGFDPTSNQNAATKYKGLFQLGPDEWSKYGNGDAAGLYDPTANTDAFLNLYKDNSTQLAQKLGRAPTAAEAYLAHQQGVTGASALLSNPDKNAVDVLAQYYPNRKVATSAIAGNGGDPNGTAGDFVNVWNNKYGSAIGAGPATAFREAGAAPPPTATPTATNAPPATGLLANPTAALGDPMKMATGLLQQGQGQTPAWESQIQQTPLRRPQPFAGFSFLG
jgi:hypothetical protein